MSRSLSVVITAYNEEPSLESVVRCVTSSLAGSEVDYEVIIVNDASTDQTAAIADRLAKSDDKIKVLHNLQNRNWGYTLRRGIEFASKEYVCMLPGDDDVFHSSVKAILSAAGTKDLILAYHGNYGARVWIRRWVSKIFIVLMNFLFQLKLRYYNGPCVFPLARVKEIRSTTYGFACMAEMVVLLLCNKNYQTSYMEMPITIREERKGSNLRVFRPKNLFSVIKTVVSLFWRVQCVGAFKRMVHVTEK